MKQFLLRLFAEDDGTDIGGTNGSDNADDNGLSGEDELAAAIRSLLESDNEEDSDEGDDIDAQTGANEDDQDSDESDDEQDDDETDEKDEQSDKQKGKKREQSKEENAKFAQQRREQEVQQRVQAELDKLKQESPEFKLAQQLSKMYNTTPEVMMKQIQETQLQQQSQQSGIPIETLRQQQQNEQEQTNRTLRLEQELNQLKFQSWQTQITADTTKLQAQYKFLEQADFDKAVDYILNTVKNVNVPLEQAVFAVHGQKIVENLANQKVQDDLAKQSGRKAKTPPAPNNGTPTKVTKATAEEKAIAKAFGMTIEDYLKYKD